VRQTSSPKFVAAPDLALIAVFAGLTAVLGLIPPIMVPISPVPVTAQSLGPVLAGIVLGARRGALSQLLLMVLVLVGLPLLSGGRGGIGVLAGVTVGFFVGWLPMSWLAGWLTYRLGAPARIWQVVIVALLATLLLYGTGLPGMMLTGHLSLSKAALATAPFVPGDIAKAILAAVVGCGVHRAYPKLLTGRRQQEPPDLTQTVAASPPRSVTLQTTTRRQPIVIELCDVSHTYDANTPSAHPALHDLTLRLDERRIGLIGHNGSGKSTLVRLLDGLINPTHGTITVDGHDTVRDAKDVRAMTGFLFASPDDQIIMPTVREDIAFGLRRAKLTKQDVAARVDAQLAEFGLTPLAERPAHLLSGGQKQLLALAGVLITQPSLLLMDEPTTLLDLRNECLFADIMAELPQTVVLATHRLDLLAEFDRVLVFDSGRLVADDIPAVAIAAYQKLMRRPTSVAAL